MEIVGVKRHAACVAACELIPVPLVDTMAQNWLRRHLVRSVAEQTQVELFDCEVEDLANEPLEPVRRVLIWPFKKLLQTAFIAFSAIGVLHTVKQTQALAQSVADRAPEA